MSQPKLDRYAPRGHTATALIFLAGLTTPVAVAAQASDVTELEQQEVVGTTPTHGIDLAAERLPYPVQSAAGATLKKDSALGLSGFLRRRLASVSANDAQNNPLQPDIQFRGFTASPLLGLPQGIAVYQNGVRINEAFGDTVNWDLVPMVAVSSLNLLSGANPLFGLNALGGAVSLRTKDGFNAAGHRLSLSGGSFERLVGSLESGGHSNRFGYYLAAEYFDEDGWRDASPSEALRLFSTLSYRAQENSADLHIQYADTDLIGNGSVPVELLATDRDAIFTAPDQTENALLFVTLEGRHQWRDNLQLSSTVYFRSNDVDSFNGDGTEFENCAEAGGPPGVLCEEDDDEPIEDRNGNPIAEENEAGEERNAINNRSTRDQRSFGGSAQLTLTAPLFQRENQLIAGGSYNVGLVEFLTSLEIARLNDRRSTEGEAIFVPEDGTALNASNRVWSLYVSDTLSLTPDLFLTVSARYNQTRVTLGDRGGLDAGGLTTPTPRLNGDHRFRRLNPAAGLSYVVSESANFYLGYSESMRAPTAVELSCAEPDDPCNLPNAFLADPPLDEVVAKDIEGGWRGRWASAQGLALRWSLGGFHIRNEDDVLFQSTGGVQSNEGFFDNVGDTRRFGGELQVDGSYSNLTWFLRYSFVRALFADTFTVSSPNNPGADAEDLITVSRGDDLPGVPDHNLKVGADVAVTEQLSLGTSLRYNSGVHLRGDEANLLPKTGGYAVVDLRGEFRPASGITLFAEINNVFGSDFESFGLLGEPDEIPGFEAFEDNRFLGPGAPRNFLVGLRLEI